MSSLKLGGKIYGDAVTKKFGIEINVENVDSHEEARRLLQFIAQQFTNHVNAHGGVVEVAGKSPAMGGVFQFPVG